MNIKEYFSFSYYLLHSCRWEREKDIDCICFNAEEQQRKKPIWIDAYNRVVLVILFYEQASKASFNNRYQFSM